MAGEEQPTFFGEVAQMVSRVLMLRVEKGDIDWAQLAGAADNELTTAELAQLYVSALEYRTAVGKTVNAMKDELARRMAAEEITSIDTATTLVTWKPKQTRKVVDSAGFWEFMANNPELYEVAFNPNDARSTGMPSSVFDTFFEKIPSVDPVLSEIPHEVLAEIRNKKERQT